MNFLKKNQGLREQKAELTKYGMQNLKLLPELLSPFFQVTRIIYRRFQHVSQNDFVDSFKSKVKEIMQILKSPYTEPTLNSITKKMSFLFVFLNLCSSDKRMDETLSAYFTQEVQILLKEIQQLAYPEKKRERSSSLKKIQLYLREKSLLGKKDEDSKLKIELNDDKTVIKRVLKEINEPFCIYMLKILQDYHLYATFIGKEVLTMDGSDTWKMFNWITTMSSIVMQMNRLARYFKEDFVGVWVFISYLISIDVSELYSKIIIKMNGSSTIWAQRIKKVHQYKKASKQKAIAEAFEILQHPEFKELKSEIEEIEKIRENMKYLYNNSRLKQWKGYFIYPKFPIVQKVVDNKSAEEEINQFIEEFEKGNIFNSRSSRKISSQNPESKRAIENPVGTIQKSAINRSIERSQSNGQNIVISMTDGNDQHISKVNVFQNKKGGFFAQKRNTIMGRK